MLGVAAVGVFPMNNLKLHTIAAMTYFRAGLLMVLFFGLAILFQPAGKQIVPPAANLLSLLAFLAYGAFLMLPRLKKTEKKPADLLDPEQTPERPRIWALASPGMAGILLHDCLAVRNDVLYLSSARKRNWRSNGRQFFI